MCRYAAICLKIPIVRLPTCLRSRAHYPKYVVTLDELAAGNINGVRIMHLADFLLKKEY